MQSFLKALYSKTVIVATCASVVLFLTMTLRIADPSFLTSVRELTFDYYQRLHPRPFQETPVRIIDIDEASIDQLGQWPWPRTTLADLVTNLTNMGAAAIIFDIVFSEPDRTSPKEMLARLPQKDSLKVAPLLSQLPDNDEVFATTIAQTPVVLGFAGATSDTGKTPQVKAGFAYSGDNPVGVVNTITHFVPNLSQFEEAASGIGSIGISGGDREGIVRRVPLVLSDGSSLYPSLASEALRVAQGARGYIVRATGASGEAGTGASAMTDLKIGAFSVPTSASGELWVYYDYDRAERYISARHILDPQKIQPLVPAIEGHIVFVGTSAAGLRDIRATPLGEQVPGVSVHAQAIEQIISGQYIARPDWANGAETLTTFAVGALMVVALPLIGSIGTALLGAAIAGLLTGGSYFLFINQGLLIDPIYPSLSSFFVFAISTSLLYFLTDKEKRFVRQAFGQYLSPELVSQLEKAPEQLALGGEIRPMTILFMDIRGFTPISEQLTPTELVSFLNTLLSPLSDAIQAEDGTIDKYIGDSIMAFWNAPLNVPNHAEKACRAGLAMLKVVEELNTRDAFGFRARNLKTQTVKIGIGLNSGDACVGNMGSARRFNYSVIGDAVNISSRIESSCKAVGAELLVSDETRRLAPEFAFLEAGEIPLKGKSEPVKLYALLGDETYKETANFRKLEEVHVRLVTAIKNGDPARAAKELSTARKLGTKLEDFYDRFEELIAGLETLEPAGDTAE